MSHKKSYRFTSFIIVLLLMATISTPKSVRAAGPWYVATTGDNSNSCTNAGSPCLTISGVIDKPAFVSGDSILIAAGTYLGNLSQPLIITENMSLSGGWNSAFTSQTGFSTLDGQSLQKLLVVGNGVTSSLDRLILQNASNPNSFHQGGAIYNWGTLSISNSTIQNNAANYGGGIYNEGSLTLNNTIVKNNSSSAQAGYGGGIYNIGTLVLNNSTVSGNTSLPGYTSHGIGNSNGSVTLNNSTVSGNTGGILNLNGSVTLNNSTVSNNTVVNSGGSIVNVTGTFVLNNSTVTANSSTSNTGGIFNNGGTVTLQNSILAGNTSTVAGPDCYGMITSSGYNIIGNTTDCVFEPAGGDLINVDAMLTPLSNNGGPTFTHALLAGSPAINAGNPATCLDTDQRGIARPEGSACEIGAYEVDIPIIALVKRSNSNPTSASSVDFTVVFSEDVIGVNDSDPFEDFILTTTGVTGALITNISGSGDTYMVTVNTGSGNGTIRLDVVDDDSILDVTNIPLGEAGAGNGNYSNGGTYTIDKTPPSISAIARANSNPTSASSVDFTVTFSESVTGVDTITPFDDFALTTTGVTGATITGVSGSGDTYTVTVNTGAGNGTIRLDVVDDNTIIDAVDNPLGGVNVGDGDFIIGETYDVNKEQILNGGFNTYPIGKKIPASWKAVNFSTSDGKNTTVKKEGTASVRITGTGVSKTLSQTLLLNGLKDDAFTFSFWVKGSAIPTAGVCRAQILFYNGTILNPVKKTINCGNGTYAFKQKALSFIAPGDYTKIVIRFTYSKASGRVWFDAVSLVR